MNREEKRITGKGSDAARLDTFRKALIEAGGEVLGPTNPYEMLRFRTKHGVGVIYSGKRGETWNKEAVAAREHIAKCQGSLSPVAVKGRRKDRATVLPESADPTPRRNASPMMAGSTGPAANVRTDLVTPSAQLDAMREAREALESIVRHGICPARGRGDPETLEVICNEASEALATLTAQIAQAEAPASINNEQ
jgi:hypothetical protein